MPMSMVVFACVEMEGVEMEDRRVGGSRASEERERRKERGEERRGRERGKRRPRSDGGRWRRRATSVAFAEESATSSVAGAACELRGQAWWRGERSGDCGDGVACLNGAHGPHEACVVV